ncbi:MAG: pyridoxal-dependent decarboxylase, exosortase A system-associated [Gammaproteobacteria bacterium]|nr:pyridoxal-dependent decarboxylase, exosortase A system-associated [Gammaproteobacteria bacterium]MBI5618890.1 pyridoxal-dependent decarboxylase, exosortase A system-associated [Gammaproteobacteria bacterium]
MSETPVTHDRLRRLHVAGPELEINGQPLSRLVARVGRTPFYAYDRAALTARVAGLRAALPAEVELHYAVKANPMPAVVGHMAPLVDGFDVASQGELLVALDAGMSPREISFAGPAKTGLELASAVAAGICVNVESELELTRLAAIAERTGWTPRIALRVNPDFELKGAGMKMGGAPRQFGIDAERIPAALESARMLGLALEGLHIFCGSQNLSAEALGDANRKTLDLAARLTDHHRDGFRFVNIGGGYGIPYFPGEKPFDLAAVGAALGGSIAEFRPALGAARIVIELGRYLVGEAGYYVCEVTDVKVSKGQTFAMVNGGLHHHLANSGNFGQVLRKNYPVVVGNRLDAKPVASVTVVGPLCTPLDIVADRMLLPALAVGDLVVVLQSGAYGYTASPQRFLSHPAPVEILV